MLLIHCAGSDQTVQPMKALVAYETTVTDTLPPVDSVSSDDILEEISSDKSLIVLESQKSAIPHISRENEKTLDYLMGKYDPSRHSDFVKVGKPYTDKEGMLLRKEANAAFIKMYQAARRDGLTLKIISSTRNFYRQKEIWEGKWTRFAAETPDPKARARRILEYSSMPGASRHHWGTDIDLNDLENNSFEAGGPHEKAYQWLSKNAHRFGFGQPYTPKGPERPEGYNEEKWHWSYLPLSKPLLQQFKNLITDEQITGFQGADMATEIGIVQNYVLGISETCK